jgi:hypothetical protein
MNVNESVDMIKLVKDLAKRARGRACIVLTHEYKGQNSWSERLAGYCQVNCVNFFIRGKLGRTFPILLCFHAISIFSAINARRR